LWSAKTWGIIATRIFSTYGSPSRSPSPPPMITASTSSRFSAEPSATPIASTARSIRWCASLSSRSSARAQMPLDRRGLPRSSMISNRTVLSPSATRSRARTSIAPRPA
jgi:hypothetical protein